MFLTAKHARHVFTGLISIVKPLLQHHYGHCWLPCISTFSSAHLAIKCKNIFELKEMLGNESIHILFSLIFVGTLCF